MATSIVTKRGAHKNKTFATLLALLFGAIGAHRFYLRGAVDKLGLLHVMSVPLSGMVIGLAPQANPFYQMLPLLLSAIAGYIEALVIGLLADDKFDLAFNPGSGGKTQSNWPLALLLVATMLVGSTVLIATISRLFDLLSTGGAYG
jgi:hypothetical protein